MAPRASRRAAVIAIAVLALAGASVPPASALIFVLCGGSWVAPGDSCPFFLPPPPVPISFAGTASAPGQVASVQVRVEVFGTVIGSCSDSAPNFAFCEGVALVPGFVPPFSAADCIVEGHRQGEWLCFFDPPPPEALPAQVLDAVGGAGQQNA